MGIMVGLFWVLVVVCLFVTLLPLSSSTKWWVRVWDMPRVHIALTAVAVCFLGVLFGGSELVWGIAILLGCIIYQLIRIVPFTPLFPTEVSINQDKEGTSEVSLLSANVLLENEQPEAIVDMIERNDADILLLMETNQKWLERLKPALEAKYERIIAEPLDNYYGLIFATNLDIEKAEVSYLSEDDTPSMIADLKSHGGATFKFIGLHPRPPVPGDDTLHRDIQIEEAAKIAGESELPVVVMGDFNEVAWSANSRIFKKKGNLADPRVGRGFISSFDARYKLLRFPIDQIYVSPSVKLVTMGRGRFNGSDHYPMYAKIVIAGSR